MQQTNIINEVLSFTKELINICEQFIDKFILNDESECQLFFSIMTEGIDAIKQCYPAVKENLNHAFYIETAENIEYTLEKLAVLINQEEQEKVVNLLNFQLHPLFLELSEEIYYWSLIYPDKTKMKAYYENEFAPHHANSLWCPEKPKYKLSILIPVFNKLEYTKQCIDSISKNTDFVKHSCELILINDGSTDATQEYFDSLGVAKIIHLKRNVKAMIFTLGFRVCEGEYLLFVNNDTIVTEGWMDNLLSCMESDPSIIAVSPCSPNTSNDQDNYYNKDMNFNISEHKNMSIPIYWEDRARLMPVIALYRMSLVNKIGFADRLFYTMEFWDDDFSVRARRSGYRQILCRDTYCHHFGSVTGKTAQIKEKTIMVGRDLFMQKHNFDAWDGSKLNFNTSICKTIIPSNDKISVLGIDCGSGDNLLRIKSYIKSMGRSVELHTIVTNDDHMLDLSQISKTCSLVKDISSCNLKSAGQNYDIIYIEPPLEKYINYVELLWSLLPSMDEDTSMLFSVTNIFYYSFASNLLDFVFPQSEDSITFINTEKLQYKMGEKFSDFRCIAGLGPQLRDEDFIAEHYGSVREYGNAETIISSQYLWFSCKK